MKAYKWHWPYYSILLKCNKSDAFRIIRHFGMEAKGKTLANDAGEKYSYYGLNLKHKVISPVKMLSLIVPGHEIPEIGPEMTLALFLDEFRLVDMLKWMKEFPDA